MHFTSFTIAALSIGTQVLAAPAHVKRTLSCIESGDLTCITKKALPVVGDALPVVGSLVARQLDALPIDVLTTLPVVDSLVARQLGALPTDVLTTVDPLTAPAVDIAAGVAGTVGSTVPIVTDLASRELDSLVAPVTAPLSPVVGNTVGTVASTLNAVPIVGPTVTNLAGSVVAAVEPTVDTVSYLFL